MRKDQRVAPSLWDPLSVGGLRMPHRVWMAPLTRMRASSPGDVPTELMVRYYRQRASAGLIISEGCQVSPTAKGYFDTPGIHSAAQTKAWRRVTDAVHEEGGLIAAQLWHVGRVSHPSFHDGRLPVAPSSTPFRSRTTVRGPDGRPARVPCPTPRGLELAEIRDTIADYRRAATNARAAGFDTVEVHAAHGYPIQADMPSMPDVAAANWSMVVMPASISLRRWVIRIPATSRRSLAAATSSLQTSQRPQASTPGIPHSAGDSAAWCP